MNVESKQSLHKEVNTKGSLSLLTEEYEFYSYNVEKILRTLRDKRQKDEYMDSLLESKEFLLDYVDDNGKKTIFHPEHKVKNAYWEQTRTMAHTLNKSGRDVIFLPEHDNISTADAITRIREIPKVVDFKYSASVKPNTLQLHLSEGFRQTGAVVLKLENMDTGQFRKTIEYMKRNNLPLGDIVLINARNKVMDISLNELKSDKYRKKIRGYLK